MHIITLLGRCYGMVGGCTKTFPLTRGIVVLIIRFVLLLFFLGAGTTTAGGIMAGAETSSSGTRITLMALS